MTLAITGIGMVTPLGLDAWESCASLRAGLSLMQDLDLTFENELFEDVPLVGCPIPDLTDGMIGVGRATRLAAAALEDLIAKARLDAAVPARAGLFIALPPVERPGTDPHLAAKLGERLAQWLDLPDLAARTWTCAAGHAGAVEAVIEASRALESGRIGIALVGGVDSLLEPGTLQGLLDGRRLKTEEHVDGLVPGEAAAFFALETPAAARARKAAILATIEGVGLEREPNPIDSDQPSKTEALTAAIRAAWARGSGGDATLVVCDLNGESYRAKEFGTVASRVLAAVPYRLWHPADSIGDTGSASAAVSICVAARALERGYAGAPRALVFAGSDDGRRGAIGLAHAGAEG